MHYEILLRMVDEQGELIPPGTFMSAAECYDLMPDIDCWVVQTVL
ncbi:MAG: EAL domain-containing protein [Cyanothece sp. SIO1E1]|nr:EAL domain-containing protein [Cyanothece sp. SIO1E1]